PAPLPPALAAEHDGPAGPGERPPAAGGGGRGPPHGGHAAAGGRPPGPYPGAGAEGAGGAVPAARRAGGAAPGRAGRQRRALPRGNKDIELRGVAQVLNLKHPNLVGLYDLRTDGQGDTWVVMEYIAGEPLSVVLARHPNGLPAELAQQWFLALARAIAYLHDH